MNRKKLALAALFVSSTMVALSAAPPALTGHT